MKTYMESRSALYEEDIGDLLKPKGFIYAPIGRKDIDKYLNLKNEGEKRLYIMISQRDVVDKEHNYNVLVSVHGRKEDLVKKEIEDLKKELPFDLETPPSHVQKDFESLNKIFDAITG